GGHTEGVPRCAPRRSRHSRAACQRIRLTMSTNPDRDRWNARFSAADYVFGTEPNVFLASQGFRLKRGQSALAVADGEGRNGVWLARQGLDVLSVDFSPAAQAKARALAAEHKVAITFLEADVHAWPYPENRFDVVVE